MPDKSKKEKKFFHGKAFIQFHTYGDMHIYAPYDACTGTGQDGERKHAWAWGWIPQQTASLHTDYYLDNFMCLIYYIYLCLGY